MRTSDYDALAQTFAAIVVQLRAAEENTGTDPPAAAAFRRHALELAESGLAQARAHQCVDEPEGADRDLTRALGRLARWADAQRRCTCRFVDARAVQPLPAPVAAAAYEFARSVVVGAANEGGPCRLELQLRSCGAGLELAVQGEIATRDGVAWLDAVHASLDARVRAAGGTLSGWSTGDAPRVRLAATFDTCRGG